MWRRADREDPEAKLRLAAGERALARCRQVEDFLWPRGLDIRDVRAAGDDPVECLALPDDPELHRQLRQFRELVRRWQGATSLPADQLVLTIGQDLFDRPVDVAITHKLAALIRTVSTNHPDWRLPELNAELVTIAKNERKFMGFSDSDTGFDPDAHRGKVVIITVHKAKGLEWDRVHLMSVNAYDFPSALPGDSFIAEKWFLRDNLNLAAEALAQLVAVAGEDDDGRMKAEGPLLGAATAQARIDYAAERLRLLYVGITRAKQELIVTWNTGRNPTGIALQPAAPLLALRAWWEEQGVIRNS